MKETLLSIVMAVFLLGACDKERDISSNWSGAGKWWAIKCVDLRLSPSTGYFTIVGNLDIGKFYFHPNGTYSRKTTSADLVDCNYPNDFPGLGAGGGFGPIGEYYWGTDSIWHPVKYDSTWTINGNTLDISHYGSWKLIDQEASKLIIKSSRTNYNYDFTLVAE
jgi:hypothetical protein